MEVSNKKNALGIGLIFLVAFILHAGYKSGPAFLFAAFVISIPLLKIAFILASDIILAPILNQVDSLFYAKNVAKKIEYPVVDGLIVKHQYQEALDELKAILADQPKEGLAYLKYCELLIDHFDHKQEAMEVGYARLNQTQLDEFDAKTALLVCDLLTDNHHLKNAQDVLQTCLPKLKNPAHSRNLQMRLDYLNSELPSC